MRYAAKSLTACSGRALKAWLPAGLLLAALLLALHPLALQAHVALAELGSSGSDAACACVSCGASSGASHHGHDAKGCPTCELLGLLASTQFALDSTPELPQPEFLAFAPKHFAAEQAPSAPAFSKDLPRGPPPSL